LQFSYTAFTDANHQFIEHIYKSPLHYKTWKGLRLCAIDGTSIRLPNEPNITEHFGVQKGKPNQADCTMGMASVFYDVLNHQVIDSTIQRFNPIILLKRNVRLNTYNTPMKTILLFMIAATPVFGFMPCIQSLNASFVCAQKPINA